jgi:hypothetical protein
MDAQPIPAIAAAWREQTDTASGASIHPFRLRFLSCCAHCEFVWPHLQWCRETSRACLPPPPASLLLHNLLVRSGTSLVVH